MKYCPSCGEKTLNKFETYHIRCGNCGKIQWINPAPAAMALINTERGVFHIKRGEGPGQGQWALPGGFMDQDELPQDTAAREVQEETGVIIEPKNLSHLAYHKSSTGMHVLIFMVYDMILNTINPHTTSEATDFLYVTKHNYHDVEYAFDHHAQVVGEFLGIK